MSGSSPTPHNDCMSSSHFHRWLYLSLGVLGLGLAGFLGWRFFQTQRYQDALRRLETYATVARSDTIALFLDREKMQGQRTGPEEAADFVQALAVVNARTPAVEFLLAADRAQDPFVAHIVKHLPDAAPRLKDLDMRQEKMAPDLLQAIGRLENLHKLTLRGAWEEEAGQGFRALANLRHLRRLHIEGAFAAFGPQEVRTLAALTELEQLKLNANLGASDLSDLDSLVKLRELDLGNSTLPARPLPIFPALERLILGGLSPVDPADLLVDLPAYARLVHLTVPFHKAARGPEFLDLLEQVPTLRDVLWDDLARLIDDRAFLEALKRFSEKRPEVRLRTTSPINPDLPNLLNNHSWHAVLHPGGDPMKYALARAQAELGVHLKPGDGHIINTLGAALLRVGEYAKARTTLEESLRISGGHPADHALLAVANWHLGDPRKARDHLASAHAQARLHAAGRVDPDVQVLLKEAESVVGK